MTGIEEWRRVWKGWKGEESGKKYCMRTESTGGRRKGRKGEGEEKGKGIVLKGKRVKGGGWRGRGNSGLVGGREPRGNSEDEMARSGISEYRNTNRRLRSS